MFGKKTTAASAAARKRQFAAARTASAVSLAGFRGQTTAEALGREAERYLRAVDEFRAEGHNPHWRGQ